MFKSDFARTVATLLCTMIVSSTFVLGAVAPARNVTATVATSSNVA